MLSPEIIFLNDIWHISICKEADILITGQQHPGFVCGESLLKFICQNWYEMDPNNRIHEFQELQYMELFWIFAWQYNSIKT